MIIPCIRCGKKINTPNDKNADYIMAEDTIMKEVREAFVALVYNEATLIKRSDIIKQWRTEGRKIRELLPDEKPTPEFIQGEFQDKEFDAVIVPGVSAAQEEYGDNLIKVIVAPVEMDIQKTGVICQDCYKLTDIVIWGIHKTDEQD